MVLIKLKLSPRGEMDIMRRFGRRVEGSNPSGGKIETAKNRNFKISVFCLTF